MTLIPVYKTPAEALIEEMGAAAAATADLGISRIRGARKIQTSRFTVTGEPRVALPENPNRRTATVKNEGANDIFIGGEDLGAENGYRLGLGDAITLEVSGELYAMTLGTSEDLYILAEVDEIR